MKCDEGSDGAGGASSLVLVVRVSGRLTAATVVRSETRKRRLVALVACGLSRAKPVRCTREGVIETVKKPAAVLPMGSPVVTTCVTERVTVATCDVWAWFSKA